MWRQLLDQRFTRSLRTRFERLWHSPRSPSCRRSPLVFQPLEPRLLLSADLAPVEGVLEVVGTADDDSVLIRVLQERLSVVLNGASFEFALEDIKEIKVDLLGGDDALLLDGSAGVALPAVQIDLGEGDNRFDADLLNPAGTLNVAAGGGRDVLSTQARWDGAHPDFAWLPTYNPGAGDDIVHAEWSSVEMFTFGDGAVDVDVRILAGDGNDRITIDLSRMFVGATRAALFEFDLDGGPGDDVANVTIPVASRGGADQEPIDPAERRAPVGVRHDGRAGTDSFALIGGDAAEQYDLRAFDDPERGRSFDFAVADLGTGNPVAELAVLSVTNVALDAAGGDDMLNADVALDANWDFALGDGADRTQIVTRIGDRFGDAHYSVRAGEGDNETLIRFGDGERGARPPSGETNITAEYRSGAGNDSVSFDWRVHLDRPLIVDVDASTGAGDDFVVTTWQQQLEFRSGKVALWDYNFDTGEGDDAVELRVAPGEGIDPLGAEVQVTSVDDPDALGRVKVKFPMLGDGLVGDAQVAGAEKLRLQTGSGDDRVTVDDVTGALRAIRLDIATGAGDDELQYVPVGRFAQYLEESLGEGLQWTVFDGGEGNDRFALATSDRAERIEIEGVEVEDIPDPLIRVTDLATSLVTFQASVLATESIGVDSAGGDDAVMAKYTLFLPDGTPVRAQVNLDVLTGEGDDSVRVEVLGGTDIAIDVDTQGGNDSIWLDLGAPIVTEEPLTRQLSLSGGAGDDTVFANIQDGTSNTLLIAEVHGGAGNDVLDIAVSGESGGMDLVLDAGDGNDTVMFNPREYTLTKGATWQARVDTGDGDDRLAVYTSEVRIGAQSRVEWLFDLGAGDDDLTHIRANWAIDEDVAYDWTVALGEGDDAFQAAINGQAIGAFASVGYDFSGGAGDDRIEIALANLSLAAGAAFKEHIDAGDGDDLVAHEVTHVVQQGGTPPPDDQKPAEFRVFTGDGDDTVATSFFDVFFDVDVEIDTGAGDDFIDAVLTNPGPPDLPAGTIELDLVTGAGNDRAALLLPAVQAAREAANKVNVDLGGGDDTLQMDVLGTPPPDDTKPAEFRPAEFNILGGAGNDTVRYRFFAIVDRTTPSASEFDAPIGLFIDLGSGNDLAEIDIDTIGVAAGVTPSFDIGVHGGLGGDRVGIDARGVFDEFDLSVDLGADAAGRDIPTETLSLNFEEIRVDYHAQSEHRYQADGESERATAHYSLGLRSDGELVQAIHEAETIGGLVSDQVDIEIGGNQTQTVGSNLSVSVGNRGGAGAGDGTAGAHDLRVIFDGLDNARMDSAVSFKGSAAADRLLLDLGADDAPVRAGFQNVSGLKSETEVVEYRAGAEIGDHLTLEVDMSGVDALAFLTGDADDEIEVELLHPTVPVPTLALTTQGGNDSISGSFLGVAGALGLALDTGDGDDDVDLSYTEAVALATGAGAGGLPHVKTFSGASAAVGDSLLAYGPQFTGGVRVALGDVNGDGRDDIITGAGPGGGTHVKVFDGVTGAELRSFFAYPSFTGGVNVASGDINDDGFADIITGADAGGGPHVKVFSGATGEELRSFFAYAPGFTGGVRVASGDVNGDGRDDIITGAGPGGGTHVKVFDGVTGAELRSFFAYPSFNGGVFVAAGDVDGDGAADVVTGADAGGGPHVKVFSGTTGEELGSFFAYAPGFTGGVRVASGDVNGDGLADIVTGAGPGAGPHVKVFDGATGAEIRSFFAYAPGFLGGVYVAAGDIGSDAPGTFDLVVDTGAGNDEVTLQLMTGASRSDTIAADLGTGADRFALEWHGALQEPSVELQLQLQVALGGADALLPEVGDEVLVSFEHGDVDRPIIVGTVWNSQDGAPEDAKRLEMTLAGSGGTLGLQSVLTGGSGSDQVTLFYAGTLRTAADGQLDARIDLGDGDDALTIDLTGLQTVGPKKLAPIAVDARGGSGRDTLVVTGTEGNDHLTLTESAVILEGAASVNFAGFEAVQVYALGGNDRVTMTGLDPRIDWLVDGGAGRDWFFARFDGPFDNLTLFNFENVKLKKAR